MDSQSKKTLFQTVLLIIFGLAILVGVALFAGNKNSTKVDKGELVGSVSIWGTAPYDIMRTALDQIQSKNTDLKISYTEKNKDTLEAELVEALADGVGPDIFTVTPEMIVKQKERLLILPYTSFPESLFRSTYVDQANLFMTQQGVIAFPMFIDPLVMYVNNDILTSNFIVKNPTTWDELLSLVPSLVKKTNSGEITNPMIGMGTYDNVKNALPIIATLLFQSGESITSVIPGTTQIAALPSNTGKDVFNFYHGFSNQNSEFYSFNNAQQTDKEMFIGSRSAFYIGFASEISDIRLKNPNLNFNITMIPAPSSVGRYVVFGEMSGWGINKMSKQQNLSLSVLQIMSSSTFITDILNNTWYAPARRDLLINLPVTDNVRTIIYKSAIISKSFWNPDIKQVDRSLQSNINQINSGLILPEIGYLNWITDIGTILSQKQKN